MGITYWIDQEKGITFSLWNGVVTAQDFLSHVRSLVADECWPPEGRLQLSDLQYTTVDESIDEAILKEAANLYGTQLDKLAGLRAAVVAGAAFEKTIVFGRLIAPLGPSLFVFNSLETACIWLGIDAGEAESTLRKLRLQAHGPKNL
jgi:hypothetical protein